MPAKLYFTNHTLTGKLDAFPWLCLDTARRLLGPAVSNGFVRAVLAKLYFTNHTLTGSRVLGLPNGALVGLIAENSPSSRCFLTAKRFRITKCPL